MLKRKKISTKMLVLLAVPVIIFLIGLLEVTNTTHIFHKKAVTLPQGTSSQDTKGEPNNSQPTANTSSTGTPSQPGDNKSSSGSTTPSGTLLAPSGTFVSNHRPSLNANDDQTSTCTTSPGATCYISFTKDGVTKSLGAQTTDRGGSAYWTWSPQKLGLSQGTWKIQATATLNSNTQTSTDALNLEVSS